MCVAAAIAGGRSGWVGSRSKSEFGLEVAKSCVKVVMAMACGVRCAGNAPSQIHRSVYPAATVCHMPLTTIRAPVERVKEGVKQQYKILT